MATRLDDLTDAAVPVASTHSGAPCYPTDHLARVRKVMLTILRACAKWSAASHAIGPKRKMLTAEDGGDAEGSENL